MTNNPGQDNPQELLIESLPRQLDRPKKLESMIDTQAMRFLEAMDFQSFDNLSSAFEKFMMDAPLFQGDVSFGRAAAALDLTARLFSTIDRDKNHLLSREEFAYLLLKTTEANRQALAWLIENFHAFTQATFFQEQISKDDIEAARNVFHGLKIAQEKFGFNKPPSQENLQSLNADELKDYLDDNKDQLSSHEASGLGYLIDHIKKNVKAVDKTTKSTQKDFAEAAELDDNEKRLLVLQGVMDAKSLKTLKGLKLNNFDSLFNAFVDFVEDSVSFRGKSPFDKASNALGTSASILTELDLNTEHAYTSNELLIVSKLTQNKDKKQLSWLVKHFDAIARVFFPSAKPKKREIMAARSVFDGLDFVRAKVDIQEKPGRSNDELKQQLRTMVLNGHPDLDPRSKMGLEQLVQFMERHARE